MLGVKFKEMAASLPLVDWITALGQSVESENRTLGKEIQELAEKINHEIIPDDLEAVSELLSILQKIPLHKHPETSKAWRTFRKQFTPLLEQQHALAHIVVEGKGEVVLSKLEVPRFDEWVNDGSDVYQMVPQTSEERTVCQAFAQCLEKRSSKKILQPSNVLDIMRLAHEHGEQWLTQECVEFFYQHIDEVASFPLTTHSPLKILLSRTTYGTVSENDEGHFTLTLQPESFYRKIKKNLHKLLQFIDQVDPARRLKIVVNPSFFMMTVHDMHSDTYGYEPLMTHEQKLTWLGKLTTALQGIKCVTSLDISKNRFGLSVNGKRGISNLLTKCGNQLEELNLSYNDLETQHELPKTLSHCTALKKLNLSHNLFDSKEICAIKAVFVDHPCPLKIVLSHNRHPIQNGEVKPAWVENLDNLHENRELIKTQTHINLEGNELLLNSIGLEYVLELLPTCTELQSLNISIEGMKHKQVRELAATLPSLSTLKHLVIHPSLFNHQTDSERLARAFVKCKSLESVDVGMGTVLSIPEFFATCNHIRHLNLSITPISRLRTVLLQALNCPNLRSLNIVQGNLGNEEIQLFEEYLPLFSKLSHLVVEASQLPALKNTLSKCQNLKSLKVVDFNSDSIELLNSLNYSVHLDLSDKVLLKHFPEITGLTHVTIHASVFKDPDCIKALLCCKNLKQVNVQDLTFDDVSTIEEACPTLLPLMGDTLNRGKKSVMHQRWKKRAGT